MGLQQYHDLPLPTHHPEYTRGRDSQAGYIQFLEQTIETLKATLEANAKPSVIYELSLGPVASEKGSTALQLRVGKLLGRQAKTKWSATEKALLKKLGTIDEKEFQLMEAFYGADIPKEEDYRRTSVERLLKYWTGESDKAREWKRVNK